MAPGVGKENICAAQENLDEIRCSDVGIGDLGYIQIFEHRSSDVEPEGVSDMEHQVPQRGGAQGNIRGGEQVDD
jgi:hypothetical protein